ncbi:bifunctional DNA primase/polymerase [Bradyrhizobium japonicum]|uniref:phage/plasmid primase, P4 family n=1 Tax=Bradyrhizobium japonicum TaxID=375 RepID=UPI001BA9083F|nr:phage/plasmid primase, P4 family [Bradyrhizobium japonicum]MBR0995564.1 bifunctional DNA primase/polymerase [Bradyrhizobium japonicum]
MDSRGREGVGQLRSTRAAALGYAAKGWPVFPCHPQTKQPLVKADVDPVSGKAIPGSGGLKKATTDKAQIEAWWRKYPAAMVGVPTGTLIGAFVVDIDAGMDSKTGEVFDAPQILGRLEAALGCALPPTCVCRTPRGGLHLYFRLPEAGDAMPRNRAGILKRIDVRGEGGYVIVPPSLRSDGAGYVWQGGEDAAVACAPAELLNFLAAKTPRDSQTGARASSKEAYGLKALADEIRILRAAADGTRNETLFHSSIKLAQLVGSGHLDELVARSALVAAAGQWPNLHKSKTTIASGFARGLAEPRAVPTRAAKNHIAERAVVAPAAPKIAGSIFQRLGLDEDHQIQLDRELAQSPLTDLGNAERFARRMQDRLMAVPTRGWFQWDGCRWTMNGAEDAARIAAQYVARSIQREADALCGSDEDAVVEVRSPGAKCEREIRLSDKLRDWGRETENDRHLTALRRQAEPMMAVDQARLDADPMKINTKNGTLKVNRSCADEDPISFYPHDPADLITKVIDAEYEASATCPVYDAFLKKVQPSPKVQRFLHQWAGLGLTGDTSEQKLLFFWGKGRNGKTTLVEAWASIYGDYACSLAVETFMDNGRGRSGGQATPDLALLPGIRFVHTDEPARNARLSESHVKLLTGGDTIQARELNKGFFSFKPQFKLTMSGNYRPKVDGGEASQGTWRRLIMVRWAITVPEQDVDRQLSAKLKAEASGILNRLLDGLRDWIDHGLLVPDEIKETTEEYRSDSDVLGRFLQECTMRAVGQRLSNAELHNLFVVWSRKNGERPWTKKSLTSAMKERDYEQSRGEERYWKDIVATKAVGDFAVSVSAEDELEGEEAENDS